jgi:hypothetical protein
MTKLGELWVEHTPGERVEIIADVQWLLRLPELER